MMVTERTIRRILVALDASPSSLSALEAAGELAASLQAELIGLFVEDEELLALTDLPFVGEVDVLSAHLRPLERSNLERQLRLQADRVESALAEVGRRVGANWSFRVQRGRVSREVLAASTEADLIILGRSGASFSRGFGSTAQVVLNQSQCTALFLKRGHYLGRPVVVLYEGSPTGDKAIEVALQLTTPDRNQLTVLILSEDEKNYRRMRRELTKRLKGKGVQVHYGRLEKMEAESLVKAVNVQGGGVMVIPGTTSLLQGEFQKALLARMECPALVVR